ncbi:MAG: hypothetical protein H0V89_13235 [Deltaproteobacteria bacterium]|nr:hypothetical protein [Deltaproteobacteria bacterium]
MIPFLLTFLAACGTSEAPPTPELAPAAAPPSTPAPGTAPTHTAGAHAHAAPHGGIVQVVGDKHVEALMMPDGILFYLTDGKEASLPVDGYSGTVVVKGPSGVETTEAHAMGDHLHAPAKLAQGQPATAVLTLNKDGRAESVSFETQAVGMQSHDHTALHGGVVVMRGNWHVEYAPKAGEYRLWLTGEHRAGVTETVTATLKDGDRVLPLALDRATGMLSAKAEGAGTRPVTVEMKVGETPFTLGFEPNAPAAGHGHDHGNGDGHQH